MRGHLALDSKRVLIEGQPAIVRASRALFTSLTELIFSRYPSQEWATFVRCGWRDTPAGLVLTITQLDTPLPDELDKSVGHVAIDEHYSLRMALGAEKHAFGVGVVHSHPEDCKTFPSPIDDDMDLYYSDYLSSFAPNRPYVSLIFSKDSSGEYHGSGRICWRGVWHRVERFAIELSDVLVDGERYSRASYERVARLATAFGRQAADRLMRSTVAVVGAGGTGSPAIELLARAGVGRIISIDPERFSQSNLERVHGSTQEDCASTPDKVTIAARHASTITSRSQIVAIRGSLPQPEVLDALVHADIVLGCTDQHHSRLALSDAALRFVLPTLDVGVDLEGADGAVTGQIIQIVRFFSGDPCALCRDMVASWRVAQELMSDEERGRRRAAAADAQSRGEEPNNYWREVPQLNTVGYLTTTAGAMAAGYAIGVLTGRFAPPFSRLQMNLSAQFFDVTDDPGERRERCDCHRLLGAADQGGVDPFVSAPSHWPTPVIVSGSLISRLSSQA